MYKKTTKASAIYRIKDDIKHFQFNLSFRHINSLLNLPKFDVKSAETVAFNNEESNDKDNVKVITIKWQEKLLNAQELEFYSNISNCVTDAQKSYHQTILEHEHECIFNQPIFTYVHEDNFIPEQEKFMSDSATEETLYVNNDVLMHVYAAINPNTLLVSLRWQPSSKTLHIYPDFNSFWDDPYFIEVDTDYRHLYAYGIENSSKQSRINRKLSAFNELQIPKILNWEGSDDLSTKFSMLPKRTRRVVIQLEIQRAEGFEYDDIHVRYHIRLPERTILEEGILSSCTHTSKANSNGVCGFGYCCEVVFLCEEDFKLENLCQIYFEVISVDSWERERDEGYSHLSFFLENDLDATLLQCHRPIEGGILEKLNRSLIGGRRKFDFERFYGCDDVGFTNRYGTTMVTTGTLAIRYQILSQNPELLSLSINRMTGMTLEDIMKAYREARRRLEAVVFD